MQKPWKEKVPKNIFFLPCVAKCINTFVELWGDQDATLNGSKAFNVKDTCPFKVCWQKKEKKKIYLTILLSGKCV